MRQVELVDIGINLGHESYDHDREAVIQRAIAAGVSQMVVTGASLDGTRRALEITRAHPLRMRCTAGCHPHHAAELLEVGALETLEQLARGAEVAAVGECGLDYFRDLAPRATQRAAFEMQLDLAVRLGKPVFLHVREAHADFVAILRGFMDRLPAAIAHCFTGTRAEIVECLDLGLHIGITGWICDERRGGHLHDLMPLIPAGRLMVETDGPYLMPRDLSPKPRSRRNEPMYLPHVAAAVARARGEGLHDLAAHTTAAARGFFALPQPPPP